MYYYREISFSESFQEYYSIVEASEEVQSHLFPIVRDYVLHLVEISDTHHSDKKEYTSKISACNSFKEWGSVRYGISQEYRIQILDNWDKNKWVYISPLDMDFIKEVIRKNFDKIDLSVVFPEDIVRVDGKLYQQPKKFRPNKDTMYQKEGKISMWHRSTLFPRKYFDFTLVTRHQFSDDIVSYGRYDQSWESYDGERFGVQIFFDREYVAKGLVEIDYEATMALYAKEVLDFKDEVCSVEQRYYDRGLSIEGTEDPIHSEGEYCTNHDRFLEVQALFNSCF